MLRIELNHSIDGIIGNFNGMPLLVDVGSVPQLNFLERGCVIYSQGCALIRP